IPFKTGLALTELQNVSVPEDDNISNDSNDFTEVENGQIRESRREKYESSHIQPKQAVPLLPGETSLGMSIFNLSNAIMGSGILGLAFALANTGIILFLLLLIAMMLLSIYSINLMLICSKKTGTMVYEKIGELLFGTPGRIIIFGATSLQNVGGILSYFFIVKTELPFAIKFLMGEEETFSDWYVDGRFLVTAVTFGIILPLCLLKTLGYLGYTSGFSLVCMGFFLIVVIYKKFVIPCPLLAPDSADPAATNASFVPGTLCKPKYVIFNSKTVFALPTIAFAFVCHPSVLQIYVELSKRSKKRMQLVTNISFGAMFIMYLLTAIFGYLTFYGTVQSDLLYKYHGKGDYIILTVRVAVVIAVILTIPVLFFTVRSSIFEMAKKTAFNWIRHIAVTVILLILLDLLVIFIPSMKDIFGVTGVTSANLLIFILPSSLYLRVTRWDRSKLPQRIWVALFLTLGILFSLVSIPLVVYDWVQSHYQCLPLEGLY
uniref:Solute carrier family 38 member 1 n=1 Tax=Sphenodon punctatus TaxID=8508 RepID=A0A8D0GX90_SPHPU